MSSFTVFLPVRNGWPHVQECVASVLAQTHADFELHVLDNKSTDETLSWLRSLRDARLRISTSDVSLSIEQSWARVRQVPKREFMTLIGHDDLLEPTFLEMVDALIARHPEAALYQTGARLINARGRTIRSCWPVPERETAADYLRARFRFQRDMFGTGFVFRSADYERVGGIPPFERLFFADDALWLSLIEGGYKACAPQELCSVRIHARSESASLPSAWKSILKGLNSLRDFLRPFAARHAESAVVVAELMPEFLLAYHRNVLIFALIDACQKHRRLDTETLELIEASLGASDAKLVGELQRDVKVRIVRSLNALPARSAVPLLFRLYYVLRTRSL